jgi:hypothetical protein
VQEKRDYPLYSRLHATAVFVVALSIDTFSKRKKANRDLLQSNLWLSGRSHLNQFESYFLEKKSNG